MNILLRVLLCLCLLAAGTCVGMVVGHRQSGGGVPAATGAPAAPAPAASLAPAPQQGAGAKAAMPAGYAPPRPLLWKVSDGDNDLYLLGSFHALKPSDYPLAPSVDAAFADAEVVGFEISPEEMTSPELGMEMMQAAMDPEGGSLQGAVDEATWHRLEAYSRTRNLPLEDFQALEPWFVSLVISMNEMTRIGYDPAQGLDQQLIARTASAGKRSFGLETGASQIAVLDGMSATEQRQSLSEALDDAENFKSKMDELHDDWRKGDDVALEKLLAVEFRQQYAQLYQRINVDRNQAWLPKLQSLLDDSHADDALVVVGSMHLLGPDGVVSQLKSRGYKVERL
jgi:uncharacterized protein YbaP (TraB family)